MVSSVSKTYKIFSVKIIAWSEQTTSWKRRPNVFCGGKYKEG